MAKTEFAERLDEIQATLTAQLKPIGFRRSGRTFNRSVEDGVVQVIGLQSGQFPIGPALPKDAFLEKMRPNLYGKFTVNLGICVREIAESMGNAIHKTVREASCQIRQRLGRAAGSDKDIWWKLDQPAALIAADVSKLLFTSGIAFLDEFATRDAIVQDWVQKAGDRRLSSRARVDVAIILIRRGDAETARQLLQHQIASTKAFGHADYVRRLARELGLGELP